MWDFKESREIFTAACALVGGSMLRQGTGASKDSGSVHRLPNTSAPYGLKRNGKGGSATDGGMNFNVNTEEKKNSSL